MKNEQKTMIIGMLTADPLFMGFEGTHPCSFNNLNEFVVPGSFATTSLTLGSAFNQNRSFHDVTTATITVTTTTNNE